MENSGLSKILVVCIAAVAVFGSCSDGKNNDGDFTRYVDTYIGTGGHGHVFMGASVPFGMVQLGPTSIPQAWDWTSGYHISDTTVIGFSHTHLSGTGIGDLSDIVFMPVVGEVNHNRGTAEDPESGMWSYFSRRNEKTRPGYYATRLDRYSVDVELTATERVGFHKYTFPASGTTNNGAAAASGGEATANGQTTDGGARIVIDLENGNCWDSPVEGYIIKIDDRTIAGYRYSRGWANDQRVFFAAEFSRPFSEFRVFEKNEPREGTELAARRVYGEASFDTSDGQPVYVKVALSPVSIDNARLNMEAELPGWDFEATAEQAEKAWNDQLGKIAIETPDESVKRIFYTGLYHTMIVPSLFCDVNGDYRGADGQMHAGEGFVNYTTMSLWDTYRAAHPLMTIIHPERVPDMVNTMLHIYKQQGKLPVWHLMGCETDCMVGNPGIPVVADAMLKGFGGFDRELAFEAMKNSAMLDERGMGLLKQYGYIPCDMYNESVATGMEYALADWSVAKVAETMGKSEDYEYFMDRSKSYRRYFDPQTGFVRGKKADGEFRTPFDPFRSDHRADDYTEGNAWQYTWLAPHDIDGLVGLFGGVGPFTAKLDSLFVATGDLGDGASPDISGLIGQYAHGNEPSHHITYIYSMVGEPWKSAGLVRSVLKELYHDDPDGLSGNEDAGQMSSWYILSSLGFYQVEPAGGRYFFGSPLIDRAVLKVRDGIFTITAKNNSPENIYIQKVTLNGQPHTKPWIDFKDIAAGGELVFEMGNKPIDN